MNTDNLKLLLSGAAIASVFVLVWLGKVDAGTYMAIVTGAVGALGGHAVGKAGGSGNAQ